MKLKYIIFILALSNSITSKALEACAKSMAHGGVKSATIKANFSPFQSSSQHWEVIAQSAQDTIGSNAAYDTPGDIGIYFSFQVTVAGIQSPMPSLLIPFDGKKVYKRVY